jgi:hypothetical protein
MNNNFSDTSDYMTEPVKQITNYVNDNQMLTYGLSILFILYAFIASPTIPENVAKIFNSPLFKLSILIIIGYVAMQDPVTAVVITMIVLVVAQRLSISSKNVITVINKPKSDIKTDAIAAVVALKEAAKNAENKGAVDEAKAHRKEANKQEAKVESIIKAEAHTVAAEEASKRGAVEEVKAHKKEAAKHEAKVDAIIKADAHVAAAQEANKRGAVEEVKVHLQEAAKQEAKIEAIVKAESHIIAAEEANKRGAVEEVKAHLKEAAKQEEKVLAIVKAETHVAAAEEANKRGAVEEVKAHLKEAAKQEEKVIAIVKAESKDIDVEIAKINNGGNNGGNNLLDDTVVPCGYEEDTLAPYIIPSTESIKITLPENINDDSNISGYDYLDYAVY